MNPSTLPLLILIASLSKVTRVPEVLLLDMPSLSHISLSGSFANYWTIHCSSKCYKSEVMTRHRGVGSVFKPSSSQTECDHFKTWCAVRSFFYCDSYRVWQSYEWTWLHFTGSVSILAVECAGDWEWLLLLREWTQTNQHEETGECGYWREVFHEVQEWLSLWFTSTLLFD